MIIKALKSLLFIYIRRVCWILKIKTFFSSSEVLSNQVFNSHCNRYSNTVDIGSRRDNYLSIDTIWNSSFISFIYLLFVSVIFWKTIGTVRQKTLRLCKKKCKYNVYDIIFFECSFCVFFVSLLNTHGRIITGMPLFTVGDRSNQGCVNSEAGEDWRTNELSSYLLLVSSCWNIPAPAPGEPWLFLWSLTTDSLSISGRSAWRALSSLNDVHCRPSSFKHFFDSRRRIYQGSSLNS